MKGPRWSHAELAYLLLYWPDMRRLRKHLRRSEVAIHAKASELRRREGAPLVDRRRVWTPERIEILRVHWDLEPREDTAARVGCSVLACEQLAGFVFGSMLRRRWDAEEREGA